MSGRPYLFEVSSSEEDRPHNRRPHAQMSLEVCCNAPNQSAAATSVDPLHRRQWATTTVQASFSLLPSGPSLVQRRTMIQASREQRDNGALGGLVPFPVISRGGSTISKDQLVIADNLLFLSCLLTADVQTVEPCARQSLSDRRNIPGSLGGSLKKSMCIVVASSTNPRDV